MGYWDNYSNEQFNRNRVRENAGAYKYKPRRCKARALKEMKRLSRSYFMGIPIDFGCLL